MRKFDCPICKIRNKKKALANQKWRAKHTDYESSKKRKQYKKEWYQNKHKNNSSTVNAPNK